ncbi:hypothetical protein C8R46DRAFT_951156 [Mycena filopes]|nr:hypothetical protein C8R46DRAFT_951156 [Mycena filopes]
MDLSDSISSLHLALEAVTALPPQHSYPELLSTSAGPPTEFQSTVLWAEVNRAEAGISIVDAHLHRLQSAVEKLLLYRENLEFITITRRGVLSALRRLPNEILVEIFQHNIIPNWSRQVCAPWVASQVCSRWRTVAVASPVLWRHIFLGRGTTQNPQIAQMLALQVQRVGAAPVSVHITSEPSSSTLALCLGLSSQWEDLQLDIRLFVTPALSNLGFPALKRLHLIYPRLPVVQGSTTPHPVPVLQHLILSLSDRVLLRSLVLPWAQLRKCNLKSPFYVDLIWILTQLRDADVSVLDGYSAGHDPHTDAPPTHSPIRSLTISETPQRFICDVFNSLSTPALEELALTTGFPPWERIAGLLRRSPCHLTHLRLTAPLTDDDQLHILDLPHIRSLVHLDLPKTCLSSRPIALLASSFPNLRRLTLCRDGLDCSLLLTAFATHNRRVILPCRSNSVVSLDAPVQVVLV